MTSHPESVVGAALEGPAFALCADLIRVKGGVEDKGPSGPARLRKRWPDAAYRATIPPSSLVMTMVAERGRDEAELSDWLAGQLRFPSSPGCWMLTNSARPSGVESMPVISHSFGPTRNRRMLVPGAWPTFVSWLAMAPPAPTLEIGRAACRERGGQYV